ncbi:sugar transferase [Microbacterium abyssi]|uniref:sugar transferase n=1 Tax=Microbacterium abyssi TaxID=2782166 RepID=UPI0018890495|nr:sugar transferase [Microbacterium sp. A18JL241]
MDGNSETFDWRRSYERKLWLTDLLVLVWVVYGTQIAWLGFREVRVASGSVDSSVPPISYWLFSAALIVVWVWSLGLIDSRSHRVIGTGTAEYVRVARASFTVFGAVAIIAFLTRVDVARGYLLISLPIGVATLVLVRWIWRQWLVSSRRTGAYSARALLVGSEQSIANIAAELRRARDSGYQVIGACTATAHPASAIPNTDIPILGTSNDVTSALKSSGADTVIVTSGDLPPGTVKRISWTLEAGKQHLVLAPSITDITGPRIHTRPVSGLPLIHVETPRFSTGQRFAKRLADIVGSLALIVVASPLLAAVAIAVKATSPGPLLFKQERIGLNGEPFKMLKFRSMHVGADKELPALLKAQGTSERPLFKLRDDPRLTPVGEFIRKYSLDELPQFFNVLGGSMSLVGPRPQIAAEVALYSDAARRRLLARPGITGLWQVSGRSDLDWEQAVRLDLYYVENWSFLGDLSILLKTAKAVFAPGETAR